MISCAVSQARYRGAALILVLWVLAALVFTVGTLVAMLRPEVEALGADVERIRFAALADAAIRIVAAEMLEKPPLTARATVKVRFGEHVVSLRVSHVSGLVDINHAPAALLADLFQYAGELDAPSAAALAERVVRWRGSELFSDSLDAEQQQYKQAGSAFEPRGARFSVSEDLIQVLGFEPRLYHRIRDLVTVNGDHALVNPLFADQRLLEVLMNEDAAGALRYIEDRDAGISGVPPEQMRHVDLHLPSRAVYRIEAWQDVSEDRRDGLLRVLWVHLRPPGQSALPWRELSAEPVRVMTKVEKEFIQNAVRQDGS